MLQHIQDQDVEGVGALDKEQFVKISAAILQPPWRRDGPPSSPVRPFRRAQ